MAKAKKKQPQEPAFCPKCSGFLHKVQGSTSKGCDDCCAIVNEDYTVDVCGNCERCSERFLNTPSQRLADVALDGCLTNAQTIDEDDGEDENAETYLGEVAMAETAQDFAKWMGCLDKCMRAGFVPKEWKR